jgi:hypothetical protein
MFDNPSTFCFDEDWNSQIGLVILFCLLYGVGVPVLLIYVLYNNRSRIELPEFIASYGSLTENYSKKYYWWEIVPVGKKALFVLGASFLMASEAELTVLYGTQLFLYVFIFMEISCQPHKNKKAFISSIA